MKIGKTLFIVSVLLCAYSLALALPPGHVESGVKASKPGKAMSLDTRTMINVNNLEMFCTNIGGFAEDFGGILETGQADGLYFPAGTDRTVLYSGGVWIGGTVNDVIRVAVGAFDAPEYWPGPADANGGKLADNDTYKIYKINRNADFWNNPVKTGINMADGTTPYMRFDSTQHVDDYSEWPEADGAPVDGNGDPLQLGDQMLWSVFNDGGTHTYDGYGGATDSLGVEVQATYWAYDLPGALGNTIFMKFVFINKSPDIIDSTYISLWADPDLGGSSDDLVGCDTTRSIGYCYNATNTDNTYGAAPPAVGYDFMQGPIIRESANDPLYAGHDFSADTAFMNTGDTIPQAFIMGLTSFNKYINGTDPDEPEESYGYMKGNDSKGGAGGDPDTPPTNPQTGLQTKFYHAGDPVKGTGWLDDTPADRRYMCNTGPFTFNPDDTQIVVAAVVVGQGADRKTSVSVLKAYDDLAQFAYDLNFDIPLPPPQPIVTATALDRKIVLSWTEKSELEYVSSTHSFEGYVVYQGETVAGPWREVAVFDVNDGEALLFDNVIDPSFGVPVFQPVITGTDGGLAHYIEIDEDYVLGGPLHNGRSYYFAVTAYSYPVGNAESVAKGLRVLNGAQSAITIVPMDDLAGSDWETAAADTGNAAYSRTDVNLPPTTDYVTVEVVDPMYVTGHDYEVRFTNIYPDTSIDASVTPPETTLTYRDTTDLFQDGNLVDIFQYWELFDVTTTPDTKVLEKQWNKSGDANYNVVDGIKVTVNGAHAPELQTLNWIDYDDGAHDGRAISWVNWGAAFFGSSADYGINFWGGYLDPTTMPDSFFTAHVVWTDEDSASILSGTSGQRGYNYLRGGTPNYGYQGYFQMPIEVYDMTDAANPRQVNVCFVENVGEANQDGTWNPDGTALGGREYFFIMRTDYDGDDAADAGTGDIDYTTEDFFDGGTFDFVYAGWFRHRGSNVMDSGDVFEWLWANPSDDNDVFSFSTTDATVDDASLAADAMDNIRVVPNPYYAYYNEEVDQFDRKIRFLGLPEEYTLRIFNVAGDMVKQLDYTDKIAVTNSWMDWNLMTDQGLPVASGIYVWYIETPSGTKYGKFAVIQEVEQLNTY
ncbi:MAG: hypothetical protein GY845_09845 [Planctomycetes bacterium]|nr:hypothetical protein [Planctomycetota bacterium]